MRLEIKNILENIVNVVLLVVTLFLTGRIIFTLLNANQSTPFIAWVYDVSAYFMTPFQGILNPINIGPNLTLDLTALVTLIAYAVIGFIIIYIIRTLTSRFTHGENTLDEHHAHSR